MAMSRRDQERRERKRTPATDFADRHEQGAGATCVKLPEGWRFHKLKSGVEVVDIMPFVAGPRNCGADEGCDYFEAEYCCHRVAGIDGQKRPYLCVCQPKIEQRCAVHDWLRKQGGTCDPDLAKSLKEQKRNLSIFNTKPGDDPSDDPRRVCEVYDGVYYNREKGFGEQLKRLIDVNRQVYAEFFYPDNGFQLRLECAEQSGGTGFKYMAVTRMDFLPRKYQYPDDVADCMPKLDDCLIIPDYDELMALLEAPPLPSAREGDRPDRSTARVPAEPPGRNGGDEDERAVRRGLAPARREPDEDAPRARPAGRRREEEEADESRPAARSPHDPTADSLGIVRGMEVEYEGALFRVAKVSGDGTSMRLIAVDDPDDIREAVAPADVELPAPAAEDAVAADDDLDDDRPQSQRARKPAAPEVPEKAPPPRRPTRR